MTRPYIGNPCLMLYHNLHAVKGGRMACPADELNFS